MSKARRKGTGYENHLRDTYLKEIWPDAERAPLRGIHDRGDFDNCGGFVVEAKKRNRWDLPSWIRGTQKKVPTHLPGDSWMVWFAGDKRTGELVDDYVVMPATLATRLLECFVVVEQMEEEDE